MKGCSVSDGRIISNAADDDLTVRSDTRQQQAVDQAKRVMALRERTWPEECMLTSWTRSDFWVRDTRNGEARGGKGSQGNGRFSAVDSLPPRKVVPTHSGMMRNAR